MVQGALVKEQNEDEEDDQCPTHTQWTPGRTSADPKVPGDVRTKLESNGDSGLPSPTRAQELKMQWQQSWSKHPREIAQSPAKLIDNEGNGRTLQSRNPVCLYIYISHYIYIIYIYTHILHIVFDSEKQLVKLGLYC